jgi:NADP-reducing hydrogenase subunit HndD
MFGAVLKSYYAKEQGIDPKNIFVVSIMPCTAKKYEAQREELGSNGNADVDVVLTTRELARMIKEAGIEFNSLHDAEFDQPMGDASGAGVIFGATGGVMEAAIRTVAEILSGEKLENIDIKDVRGTEGIKEAEVKAGDIVLKAAVAHGLGNARKLIESIQNGEKEYHFIEIWDVQEAV